MREKKGIIYVFFISIVTFLEWSALILSENGKWITVSSYNSRISVMQGCAIQKGGHLVNEVVMLLLGILSLLLLKSKKGKQFISQKKMPLTCHGIQILTLYLSQEQRKCHHSPLMRHLAFLWYRWSPLVHKRKKGMISNSRFPNTELHFTVLCRFKQVSWKANNPLLKIWMNFFVSGVDLI